MPANKILLCRRRRRRSTSGCPCKRAITRYLEATGNTAPVKNVDLVARVQGFLQSIKYKDGAFVKEGTHAVHDRARNLQAEARTGAGRGNRRAGNAAAGRGRLQAPAELVQRQAVSQATLDTSTATRDNAQASLLQAQVNTKIAAVNYGYTHVAAPFDGVVSAHLVSVGELVGATSPTQLATIVAARPDLGELQRQRTGRAADPRGGAAGAG